MAKGQKHGSDRRERLLGSYAYGGGHPSEHDLPDLREEDVWSSAGAGAGADASSNLEDSWSSASGRDRSDDNRSSRGNRWLGQQNRQLGGLSHAFEEAARPAVLHQYGIVDNPTARGRHHRAATSAPVNVPDWGRILRTEPVESLQGAEGDDEEWVPPHEYLAREHGKMEAASVFEGVGRTLKGRDMSRVRDAVWSQTGFFG